MPRSVTRLLAQCTHRCGVGLTNRRLATHFVLSSTSRLRLPTTCGKHLDPPLGVLARGQGHAHRPNRDRSASRRVAAEPTRGRRPVRWPTARRTPAGRPAASSRLGVANSRPPAKPIAWPPVPIHYWHARHNRRQFGNGRPSRRWPGRVGRRRAGPQRGGRGGAMVFSASRRRAWNAIASGQRPVFQEMATSAAMPSGAWPRQRRVLSNHCRASAA